ncbi:succinate dehydrogenase, hydrophobic membrane anchor protein [Inquilinus sp. CAU 1745]|uniref:succinate dehydrogenase, hydrophobic membrane anchor protein n=1 Tax=Inquilinus sp. CAU 1745 TaxID=3140369 RepID=UPI00325AB50F
MAEDSKSLRTPIALARGLGSAKEGVHHWWMQRLSAVALIPLTLWFVASIVAMAGADYAAFAAWISNPVVAILMILLVVATFYHAQLGLQVVYEDYIHTHLLKIAADVGTKLAATVLALGAVFAILKIALGA